MKMKLGDQTTSTSKVRRVDFGDCGPAQPPQSRPPSRTTPRCSLGGTDWNAGCEDPRQMLPGAPKFGFGVPDPRTRVQDWKSSVDPFVSGERTRDPRTGAAADPT
jgi:hypothetical protein